MTTLDLLLLVASAQLGLFTIVCGLILRELRRARREAWTRGGAVLGELRKKEATDLLLVLEEETRRTRKALQGVRGDGA